MTKVGRSEHEICLGHLKHRNAVDLVERYLVPILGRNTPDTAEIPLIQPILSVFLSSDKYNRHEPFSVSTEIPGNSSP